MRVSWILGTILLARLVGAADLDRLQIWSTLGAASGVAYGETLLDVQRVSEGSLVRYVYAGLGDVGCGRTTVLAWRKTMAGISPEQLASPADVCKVTQQELGRVAARHRQSLGGIEDDSTMLVSRCGADRHALSIRLQFENLRQDDPDFRFLERLWTLEARVIKAAWGVDRLPFAVEPEAQREGEAFVELARREGYEKQDPIPVSLFPRVLEDYQRPIPKPQFRWTVDVPTGVRLARFVEPLPTLSAYDAGVRSYAIPLRLTVDRRSGKVANSESPGGFDSRIASAWRASQDWVFEASTVPADGVVAVTVRFQADCGPAH